MAHAGAVEWGDFDDPDCLEVAQRLSDRRLAGAEFPSGPGLDDDVGKRFSGKSPFVRFVHFGLHAVCLPSGLPSYIDDYHMDSWEPIWSLAEEAGIVITQA